MSSTNPPTHPPDYGCRGKRRYRDRIAAELHAADMNRNNSVPVKAYRCPYCKGWHVGGKHPKRKEV